MICLLTAFAMVGSAQRPVTGTIVSTEGGNAMGTVCLKVGQKTRCLEWEKDKTIFVGFANLRPPEWENSWSKGTRWQITYRGNNLLSAKYIRGKK